MTKSREWIREAIWLHLYLLLEVDHQGRLCRNSERIGDDLGIEAAQVESWLGKLCNAGLVAILNPSPFLVLKLPLWSGRSGNQALVPSDSQDSYRSRAIAAISNQGEKGGQGEGEGLLREILDTLGESDPEPFRRVLERFSPAVVRQALARVRAARPDQIRKSKIALFRYLLVKLSRPPSP
jgi:hypothetical protein